MGRFARSWQMFTASWRVLRSRKELVVFPILSGAAGLLVAIIFLTPAVFTLDVDSRDGGASPATYVLLVAFYLVSAYVAIFFNTALISQAHIALMGGDPSVAGGLRTAGSMAGRLLPWALLSATVSMIIRAIEERLGFVGRIIGGMVGMAWHLVTYLVLPVMVLEGATTKPAVKRSVELFRGTWGENVLGNAGIGAVGFLLFLPSVLLVGLGIAAGGAVSLVLYGLAVLWFLVSVVVSSALSGIYQTALYHYAAERAVPREFAGTDLGNAFPQKRR
ncbi:DUF6159 family protein [Actinophytocola oryzae]|uniref:Glycerophosphoryl diester phosphodiesterase family protein n=1 Tax=Actinophytocola oryzae TaxID=502181 RepID=A0A4R7V1K3_9PSEU|nr:DUF6159 family protein [Actinophytocola oryzae]TDV42720.1 hypothetical protein CLV71_117192 [Actinophytocola oryzae]